MKNLFRAAAGCCGVVIGAAAALWESGWCSGTALVMILIGCGCGLFVALHELAVIRAYEEAERKAVLHSAYKAEFFKELEKL